MDNNNNPKHQRTHQSNDTIVIILKEYSKTPIIMSKPVAIVKPFIIRNTDKRETNPPTPEPTVINLTDTNDEEDIRPPPAQRRRIIEISDDEDTLDGREFTAQASTSSGSYSYLVNGIQITSL